ASTPFPLSLKLFLLSHTIYQITHLFFLPYDIFTTHYLPITVPNSILERAFGLRTSLDSTSLITGENYRSAGHVLLDRMRDMDFRTLYTRFGHEIMSCEWCLHSDDYILYGLPRVMAPYVGELVVVALLGLGVITGKDAGERGKRWRKSFGWVLGIGSVMELGVRWGWEIRIIDGDCLH
ncbi:hypothetical protein TREMEDRAFT_18302, partial [Tremella mesenterica DSM 1558]